MLPKEDLWELKSQAHSLQETDPDHAIALFEQVIAGFAAQGDERAELEATHWLLQTLNCFAARHTEALEVGVRAVIKARKPVYDNFSTRICIHEDLISAYLGVDPEGYEKEIRDLLAYMRGEVSETMQCSFCLRYRSFDLEWWREDYEAAYEIALESLAKCERGWFGRWHRVGYLSQLCSVACLSEWGRDNLLDWAIDFQKSSREQGRPANAPSAAMYVAAGYRWRGEIAEAKKALAKARRLAKTRGLVRFGSFYEAARAYAQFDDAWPQIPALCDAELELLQAKNTGAMIARVHRIKCEALSHLGILDAQTLDIARTHAAKLRAPQRELTRLQKLAPNF